jgi:ATP-binding protein involved in chromosome partitioning
MKFTKKEVEQALKTITAPGAEKNLLESGVISNLMIFGDQIDLDVRLQNPTLQARKNSRLLLCK